MGNQNFYNNTVIHDLSVLCILAKHWNIGMYFSNKGNYDNKTKTFVFLDICLENINMYPYLQGYQLFIIMFFFIFLSATTWFSKSII